jgi:hypothetical protein
MCQFETHYGISDAILQESTKYIQMDMTEKLSEGEREILTAFNLFITT